MVSPNDDLMETMRHRMKQKPYSWDKTKRLIVRDSVVEVCRYRIWNLFALHVRTNHLHALVGAPSPPEPVMNDFKRYTSRNLNLAGVDPTGRRRWAGHGSTKYLWTRERFLEALNYVLYQQGPWMEVLVDSALIKREFGIDLPPDMRGIQKWLEEIQRSRDRTGRDRW